VLADSPPTICKLEIAPHFEALTEEEKLYAHHISRASFLGTRIVLRQVSPESEGIYDLIIATYNAVNGDWKKLSEETGVSEQNVRYWVEYAAQFLGNLGNYKVGFPFDFLILHAAALWPWRDGTLMYPVLWRPEIYPPDPPRRARGNHAL
jgi:hypothetical protein